MPSNNPRNNDPLYLKRSEAAKRGWITRRANMAARQNADRNYEEQSIGGRVVRVAHQGNAIDYAIDNNSSTTPERVLENNRLEVFRIIRHESRHPMKINFKLHIQFQHINNETGEVTIDTSFMSSSAIKIITLTGEELEEKYREASEEILQKIFEYVNKGSGWSIKSILGEHLHISHYDPINGSSFIDLPEYYRKKKSLVNIKNKDNLCGKWAIVSSLHQKEMGANIGRVGKRVKRLAENYNWENIEFPLTLEGIKEFEKNNKEVGVIVFTTQGDSEKELEKITPLYISKREETLRDEKLAKIFVILGHYCVITSEKAFLGEKQNGYNADLVCRKCLHKVCGDSQYSAIDRLERHRQYCNGKDYCRENFPKKGDKSIYKFRQQAASLKLPMIVSADFECLLSKIPPPLKNQKTIPTQMHVPVSFGLNIDRFDGKNSYTEHVGLDSPRVFVEKIEEIAKNYLEELGKPGPMLDVEKANKALKEATECWICGGEFGDGNLVAVRDHDHYLKKFRGIAHSKCNLELQRRRILPVFFHGLSNYDESLFFRELNYNGGVEIIPKNEENFISFQKTITLEDKSVEIRFLDSFRFMSASLASLVEIMPKEAFKNLRREFPKDEEFDLLCQKGIFFYDYFDSMDKLEEIELPDFEHWYNALDKKFPSEEEIERAHKVWKVFGCKTIKDYMKLYQKSDVLLLADVLEYFREKSLRWFGLDPTHFITAPSLGINALLKKTKVQFPLFTEGESEMYRMCEMLIRGGICNAPTRYAEANNKYMENYDPSKPSSFIKNLDTNSLYLGIMANVSLPDGNFKMLMEKECKDWEKICRDGVGCILFVDLDYPWELHDLHNEFPLAVEKGEKLTPTLSDKKFYPVHYKNLKYYIEKGLVLKKVYSGIKFTESCWMSPYAYHCIALRQKAENDFDKEFLKLMGNSPFGKFMENVRKRANIVCGNDENFLNLVQKPAFKGRKILSENLSLNHFKNLQVTLNKPIILGACILELSKLEMARKYDGLKEKYGDKMSLLYTDTDSLFPHIYTEDWYEDIKDEVKEKYDTSNIPEDHRAVKHGFPVGVNKKVLHMLKDECKGKEIEKLVALGPKLYSYDKKVKAKGIKKSVIKNELTFKDLNQCRLDEIPVMRNMNLIKSIDHNNYTINVSKVALKAKDDKRFVLEDKIHTLAPGHWRLLGDGTYIPFSIPLPKRGSLGWKCLCRLKGV